MNPLELIMLICFGASWPTSLMKTIKNKSTQGKSIVFLFLIDLGYVAGIANKILNSLDFVLLAYLINFAMVTSEIILYFYYKRKEKLEKA